MYRAKPRCTWRARRIAWCRKFGKFCDAPREYETCTGYEPIRHHHEAAPFVKVGHNISLLREQVFSKGVKYRFVIRTLWGPDSYDVVAKDTTEASVKLAKRLGMTEAGLASILDEVWEYKTDRWVKIFPTETKEWREAFPETVRLMPLFDMQDSLIEHKFPHEKAAIIDTVISLPGDIYREMTHAYPHYGYVGEKWEKLTTYCARPPLSWLQAGDWEEIRNQLQDPSYKALRDQYLSNLQMLREATMRMDMDPKRQAVMIESLDMIKALILWFESQDPYAPPRQQLDRLTDAVAGYFPREFFERPRIQIPPVTDMLNIHATHPSYTSMYSIPMSSTLELKNRFGPELKQMISEAESQKREVGVMLCQTPTGDLHLSRACWGRRGTVTVADCHDGLSPLGSFHVHLGGTSVFSPADLELAIRKEQLSCLGYTKAGMPALKCIAPKRYYDYPYKTRAEIKHSLDHAGQDIDRATQLYRSSPANPEAMSLSQRAQGTLRHVEQFLSAYEVQL